ncbi:winged helix-turn-helix domain-containing protein [Halobacteriales archaeon SW_8_65_20]|nr:MAG: winged helix-turn-helix domain-containing protein [Halobacteriales archaeon SW_8_65_20]
MADPGRKPTITDAEILRVVRLLPDPVVTANEISDEIDMTPQGVNSRLDDLVEDGYLRQKNVGSRAVVYWLTESGKEKAATEAA